MSSTMRWLSITKKAGRELVRDRMGMFFSLLFPLMFIIIFGIAFGQFSGENTTYNIAVINYDEGITLNNTQINHGQIFVDILSDMKYQDSEGTNTSTHVFDVRSDITEEKAQELVEDRDIAGYVIIPHNFSSAVFAESMRYVETAVSASITNLDPTTLQVIIQQLMGNISGSGTSGAGMDLGIPDYDRNASAVVLLKGDPSQSSYITVSGIVDAILRNYLEQSGTQSLEQTKEFLPIPIQTKPLKAHVAFQNSLAATDEFTGFDYIVPGLVVFALLMGSMSVTITLARESSRGTLTRLKLTKMTSFDMLFGTTVPYTILAMVQMLILLGVAVLIGYNYSSDANLGLAFIIVLIGALASVALGLILAAIAKSEDQAGNLAPAVCVPLSFLTGAFFPMPSVTLTDNFLGTGKSFEIFDWLPWTQASKALAKVMTFGATFDEVALDIGIMITFTIIIFMVGVVLYHKNRLKAE